MRGPVAKLLHRFLVYRTAQNLTGKAVFRFWSTTTDRSPLSLVSKEFALPERLYLEGDAVTQVFLPTSGLVKTTQRGPGGTGVAFRVAAPGEGVAGDHGIMAIQLEKLEKVAERQ